MSGSPNAAHQRGDHRSRGDDDLDVVTLEIIQAGLVATCEEMADAMIRTAYSPIFAEGRDFSIAIFDRHGEMAAQGAGCPSQLGAMPLLVEWCLYDVGEENIEPGDVIMHNDAFRGGTHLPEFTMIRPVFVNDELIGYATNIAHHVDIGGKSAGGFPGDATDVFMEGFRLPVVKLFEAGVPNLDIWRIYLSNTRLPVNTYGDLHAMYASLLIAERRITEICDRYGAATYTRAIAEIIDDSERRMRSELASIPDGVYFGSEVMEDDGVTDRGPYEIFAAVVVDGDEMTIDFTGSSEQALGPINCPLGVTASGVYNGLLQLTDPDIPTNSGCFRPLRIIAPPGTITNVVSPGACFGGITETHNRIVDVLHAALATAIPDRVAAPTGSTCCNLTYGSLDAESGEFVANYQWESVGWGAALDRDGNSSTIAPGGNSRLQSVEVIEHRFPWLVHRFALRTDSGGPGRYRGGLGTAREMEALVPMQINGLSDRFIYGASGFEGGESGATGAFLIKRAGCDEWKTVVDDSGRISPSKFADIRVEPGDRVLMMSPGGGGFGHPTDRDRAAVAEDLFEGYISRETALEAYGYDIVSEPGATP